MKFANEEIDATYSRCELQFGENSRCVIIVFTSHNNRASDDTNITEELRKLTTTIRIDVYLAYRVADFTGYISIETCRLPPRICVVCIRAHRLCNWAVIFCDFGERGELHIIDYDRECMHVSCATVNARRRPMAHEFVVARAMTCVFDYLFLQRFKSHLLIVMKIMILFLSLRECSEKGCKKSDIISWQNDFTFLSNHVYLINLPFLQFLLFIYILI